MTTDPPPASRGWLPVAALVVVLDQLTKWWAVTELQDRDIDVFWTLRFNLSYNTGMAFGTGQGWGPVIGAVALIVIVVLLVGLSRPQSRLGDVAVGMVIGGAIGNVIDRLVRDPGWLRGGVVDFIDFQWFPIFNVADMGITIGGALLIISSWRSSHRDRDRAAGARPPTAESDDGVRDDHPAVDPVHDPSAESDAGPR